jgi:hypothetical protein
LLDAIEHQKSRKKEYKLQSKLLMEKQKYFWEERAKSDENQRLFMSETIYNFEKKIEELQHEKNIMADTIDDLNSQI